MPRTHPLGSIVTNQVGDITPKLGLFPVGKYGLGFGLISVPGPEGGKLVLDRYYWGGLFSTNFWVDPPRDLVAVIMTQVLPTNHGHAVDLFRERVAASIVK